MREIDRPGKRGKQDPRFSEKSSQSCPKKLMNSREDLKSAPDLLWSARLYLRLDPSQVHVFRFHLEAMDNLGIMSVVDRWKAVLLVRYAPGRKNDLMDFLNSLRSAVPFELAFVPSGSS